jgi:hypothetical protein
VSGCPIPSKEISMKKIRYGNFSSEDSIDGAIKITLVDLRE